jgi:peptidoglycan/LPS O-acetylase OafA/YrhL
VNKEFSAFLDLTRWVAALLVVIGHMRHLLMVDFAEAEQKNILIKLFYFITGFGHEAVVLFFVMSGVLVGGLTLKKWQASTVQCGNYFASRISRLYIVLVPALVVGFLFDYTGYHFFNGSEIYTNASQYGTNSLKPTIMADLSLPVFLGNLLMLENVFFPIFGSNGPLWSLAYEWWYYCLFAAIVGAALSKTPRVFLAYAIPCLAMLWMLPLHLLVWMLIWWLGVGAYYYATSRLPKIPLVVSTGIFLIAMLVSRFYRHDVLVEYPMQGMLISFLFDAFIGVSYALMVIGVYHYNGKFFFWQKLHQHLADFSYSLYLVHFPLLVFLMAVSHDKIGARIMMQPDFYSFVLFICMLCVLYAFSYAFFWFTERHTYKLRQWLRMRVFCVYSH